MSEDGKGGDRQELSKERTEYAEDRTVLANERTFASWFRTGFASAAIGLGFHALFDQMEPWWAPRAIASLFLVLGLFVFVAADRRASKVLSRLRVHEVKPFDNTHLRVMTLAASVGVVALLLATWFLPINAP